MDEAKLNDQSFWHVIVTVTCMFNLNGIQMTRALDVNAQARYRAYRKNLQQLEASRSTEWTQYAAGIVSMLQFCRGALRWFSIRGCLSMPYSWNAWLQSLGLPSVTRLCRYLISISVVTLRGLFGKISVFDCHFILRSLHAKDSDWFSWAIGFL